MLFRSFAVYKRGNCDIMYKNSNDNHTETFIMAESTYSVLNIARDKILSGDDSAASSYYTRAANENVPFDIIDLHKMTKGYTLLPMTEYSPVTYFERLKNIKKLADSNEAYRKEYEAALDTLVNIKDLFLRDAAVNYFCEVCVSSWQSNYGRSLDDMYLYIKTRIGDIVENDCYGFATYKPSVNLYRIKADLLTVEAYSLNLLLMYVAFKNTHYNGKTYYANTMDFGDYSLVTVNSYDSYSHSAAVMTRVRRIGKEAYYDDYRADYEQLSNMLGRSVSGELKKEITRLVDYKDPKSDEEKKFFEYEKLMAKDDLERRSFYSTFGAVNPFYFMVKPLLKVCLGAEEVGSFDIDTVFTRKRGLGVCHMLSLANDWSVEMVRTCMFIAGCFMIGVLAYAGLGVSMKAGYCLPNLTVYKEK